MSVLSIAKWCVTVHIFSISCKSLCEGSVFKELLGAGLILKSVKG